MGHGHNESILTPKMVKSFIEHKVTALSLGIDHSLFLTSAGQVNKISMYIVLKLNSANRKLNLIKKINDLRQGLLYTWTGRLWRKFENLKLVEISKSF